jgi:hypothetical protein
MLPSPYTVAEYIGHCPKHTPFEIVTLNDERVSPSTHRFA